MGNLSEMEQKEQLDYFTALNDDCLFEIFDRSLLDDLCVISKTCKKMRKLVEYHFVRRYPQLLAKQFQLMFTTNGRLEIISGDRYTDCFSRHLQSIRIRFGAGGVTEESLRTIRAKCGENIKRINFVVSSASRAFQEGLEGVFPKVETIRLDADYLDGNFRFDKFLHQFPLLKTVDVSCYDAFLRKVSWKELKCPEFKGFVCQIKPSLMPNALETFLQRNPTITHFGCRIWYCPPNYYLKQVLEIVIRCEHIEELFLDIGQNVDFSSVRNELKMLDERTNFKRLRINAQSEMDNLSELACIKSFTELFLDRFYWNMSDLSSLVNLKTFGFRSRVDKTDVKDLSQSLKCLEKVYFHRIKKEELKSAVLPFVCNSVKLNEIWVVCHDFENSCFDIAMLNNERKKLKDATKTVITIEYYGEVKPLTPCNKPNYDLISLKFVPYSLETDELFKYSS